MALITGPNKNRNKLLYSSSIVLFSAGERGSEKSYFKLKKREDKLKFQIIKHKLMFIFTTKFLKYNTCLISSGSRNDP